MGRVAAAGLAVAAALAVPGTARADEVCVIVTVTTVATGPHSITPPCLATPFATFPQNVSVGSPSSVQVDVEFSAPRLSSP